MREKHTLIIAIWAAILIFTGCTTVKSENNDTYTIYKIGNNSITKIVTADELDTYVNDNYEWSVEPTVLLYTADNRTSWIRESEAEQYKQVGWSEYSPVTIYSNIDSRNVLMEEVEDYLATGVWFRTIEEARPYTVSMDAFTKTNFSPEILETILTKGLSGYGQAFFDMEQKYSVNSIFAIAVAQLESGSGTSSIFRTRNNAFGIGINMRFGSVEACIDYFGQLMNKSLYYGKSIDSIGDIYCDDGWAPIVKQLMSQNYTRITY